MLGGQVILNTFLDEDRFLRYEDISPFAVNWCSCIRESCHRLCRECDKVFHKSSSKRSHIRLCVPAFEEEELLSTLESRLQAFVSPLTLRVLPRAATKAPHNTIACFFRDALSACLLSSIGSIVAETSVRAPLVNVLTRVTCAYIGL